ncbi:MAG TPA: hypothetical protein VF436_08975 [Dyella sp.]
MRIRYWMHVLALVCMLSLMGMAVALIRYMAVDGLPRLILVGLCLLAGFSLAWIPGLLRRCRVAHADCVSGSKRVVRGPLLAIENLAVRTGRRVPRFRWLVGDTLIRIDPVWDMPYMRDALGARIRRHDCVRLQRLGMMIEVHVSWVSGRVLAVAEKDPGRGEVCRVALCPFPRLRNGHLPCERC